MSVFNLINTLETRVKELDKKKTENGIHLDVIEKNENKIEKLADILLIGQDALQFLEDVANSRRGAMKGRIEEVVTDALQLIYGPKYSVELDYSVKNNRSCMDILMKKSTANGDVIRDMNGFGGGVSDCISVPLRLLVLLGSMQTDRVCILDEAYKHVDTERVENVSEFIKEVADKLKMQVIMFSHHEIVQYSADKVYKIKDVNGTSEVL